MSTAGEIKLRGLRLGDIEHSSCEAQGLREATINRSIKKDLGSDQRALE